MGCICTCHDRMSAFAMRGCCWECEKEHDPLRNALLQVEELRKQLRTAQEVIYKHATDGIEGLHCVDCVAEPDVMCDCPMLMPFWAAMKGYEGSKTNG